jgi:hypothetical protein
MKDGELSINNEQLKEENPPWDFLPLIVLLSKAFLNC